MFFLMEGAGISFCNFCYIQELVFYLFKGTHLGVNTNSTITKKVPILIDVFNNNMIIADKKDRLMNNKTKIVFFQGDFLDFFSHC